MSVAGFDFRALNQRFLATPETGQPLNLAGQYGVSVVKAPVGPAWRCIGIYHLAPDENNRRHNVFVDVLDEQGKRLRSPLIRWTWWIDQPVQTVRLDKPDDEPATDIPVEKSYTVTLWVDGDGLRSDSVASLHVRHADEGVQNTYGHHSFYVVFQRRRGDIIAPPGPVEPPVDNDELAALRAENAQLRAAITSALAALATVGAT